MNVHLPYITFLLFSLFPNGKNNCFKRSVTIVMLPAQLMDENLPIKSSKEVLSKW